MHSNDPKSSGSRIIAHDSDEILPLPSTDYHAPTQTTSICKICSDSKPNNERITLECDHSFCKTCLSEYLKNNMNYMNEFNIQCPEGNCMKIIQNSVLRQVLVPEQYAKYEALALKKISPKNDKERICPKPGCSKSYVPTKNQEYTICTFCNYQICNNCLESWHPGKSCHKELDTLDKCQKASSSPIPSSQNKTESRKAFSGIWKALCCCFKPNNNSKTAKQDLKTPVSQPDTLKTANSQSNSKTANQDLKAPNSQPATLKPPLTTPNYQTGAYPRQKLIPVSPGSSLYIAYRTPSFSAPKRSAPKRRVKFRSRA